jgi:protein-disulfide isomerase
MAESNEKKEGIKIKVSPWAISTLILLAILAILLAYPQITGRAVSNNGNGATGTKMSADEAANKSIDYINQYILAGQGTATFISVKEDNGLYNLKFSIAGRQYDSYVTTDGKLLFPSAIDISKAPETTETTQETTEAPKSDKPEVHAFVMSYCPYGLQFMKAYIPVIELLGNKANLEVNFVHYAMHGEKELTENTRMYCIQKEQKDKFTDYLRCFVESDDYEKCISETGIDKTKLESCISSTDKQFNITGLYNDKSTWSGGSYPQYPVDAILAKEYGVGGSPTFIINGQEIQITRSANAIKEAVCAAFNTPPEECEQPLSTTAEQPGIGPIGSGSASTASSGGCA